MIKSLFLFGICYFQLFVIIYRFNIVDYILEYIQL